MRETSSGRSSKLRKKPERNQRTSQNPRSVGTNGVHPNLTAINQKMNFQILRVKQPMNSASSLRVSM